jgi:hypothetical protein
VRDFSVGNRAARLILHTVPQIYFRIEITGEPASL